MTHLFLLRCAVLGLSLSLATLPAWADDDCDAPMERWQSREAVRQLAARQGWQIQRLKIDDGCYELRATNAQGRSFKAKLDPETLRVIKMKIEDHPQERSREREREHRRDRAQEARPSPSESAPPWPASAPGLAPSGALK